MGSQSPLALACPQAGAASPQPHTIHTRLHHAGVSARKPPPPSAHPHPLGHLLQPHAGL